MFLEHRRHLIAFREIQFDKGRLRIHRLGMPGVEIVNHNHLVPQRDQQIDSDTSDISGSAGNNDFHSKNEKEFEGQPLVDQSG